MQKLLMILVVIAMAACATRTEPPAPARDDNVPRQEDPVDKGEVEEDIKTIISHERFYYEGPEDQLETSIRRVQEAIEWHDANPRAQGHFGPMHSVAGVLENHYFSIVVVEGDRLRVQVMPNTDPQYWEMGFDVSEGNQVENLYTAEIAIPDFPDFPEDE